jgi:hypothetical protein
MGKVWIAAATGALQRGAVDSFVAKKWKGKGRGSSAARRHVARGEGGPGSWKGHASGGGGWQSGQGRWGRLPGGAPAQSQGARFKRV